ncbi:hypothetical protein QTL95_25820 [Rhizobium sp. S152]|nr:hypothetical protein [Rhizobium sp. S152]
MLISLLKLFAPPRGQFVAVCRTLVCRLPPAVLSSEPDGAMTMMLSTDTTMTPMTAIIIRT